MGCSRETQNLFRFIKDGNLNRFWYYLKRFNKLTYEDTFMPIVCKLVGHKKYIPEPELDPNDVACKRCHRWIN